ncbi:MAG: carboxymuconolactone decarboxylase family protein [Betaproteobacteria bacterium]|nr:carboxymuconolactone decarboxylase family protein [Betaproteobacteria bacterium]
MSQKPRKQAKTAAARAATKSSKHNVQARRLAQLKQKYGARGIDGLLRAQPHAALQHIEWCDAVDAQFTRQWLDFVYGGMTGRGVLDERTRCLILVGQFLVMNDEAQFAMHIRNALDHASAREVLEVILQATVYLGYPKIMPAVKVFTRIAKKLGRLKEITKSPLSIAGGGKRSLEAERASWGLSEQDFPRREELMRRFGWEGISTGLRLQPSHHHKTVEQLERVDPHFLKLWLDWIYAGMYVRGILDDKTRILCVIGELMVMGEFIQAENHIRNALTHGATPREVMEVVLQSTVYVGMPRFVRVVALLERIFKELGVFDQITRTMLPVSP